MVTEFQYFKYYQAQTLLNYSYYEENKYSTDRNPG